MKNITRWLTLDVTKKNSMPIYTFKENDDAVLNLALFKDSVEFGITGQTVSLGAKAGKYLIEQVDGFTISNNKLTINLKNSILQSGVVHIELKFTDSDGSMTSTVFNINVESKVLNDKTVAATNEFDTLSKTAQKILTDYEGLRKIIIDKDNAANLQNQIDKTNSQLEQKANLNELEIERGRIDNLIALPDGSTTNDARLEDIKIDSFGFEYSNPGSAVREISSVALLDTANMFSDKASIISEAEINSVGIVINSSGWCVYDSYMNVVGDTLYYFNAIGYDVTTATDSTARFFIAWYNENKEFISKTQPDSPFNFYSTFKTITFSDGTKKYVKPITSPINAKYAKIQLRDNWLNYKIEFMISTEIKSTYIPYRQGAWENDISNLKDYVDNGLGNNATNIIGTNYKIQDIIGTRTAIDDCAIMMNGLQYDADTFKNATKLSASSNKIAHDSTMCIKNNKAYVVYISNDVDFGDSPSFPDAQTILAITDITSFTNAIERIVVAKIGDSVGNLTITSGVGVPNCVLKNDTLNIIFSAKLSDNKWYLMCRRYNISTSTLSGIEICKMNINGEIIDFETNNISNFITTIDNIDLFISMNAQIGYDDTNNIYYCGVCVVSELKNSLIFTTQDFSTFNFWLEPNFTNDSNANFEGACYYIDGYLYYGLRQNGTGIYKNNKMILAKIDTNSKSILSEAALLDATSRSCFFECDNNLYLMHSTYNRQRVEFIRIDKDNINNSSIVCEGCSQGVYPSVIKNGDWCYMASTGASSTAIYLRKFKSVEPFNYTVVANKISAKFGLVPNLI